MVSAASVAIDNREDAVALARGDIELGEQLVQERLFGGLEIVVRNDEPSDEAADVPAHLLCPRSSLLSSPAYIASGD